MTSRPLQLLLLCFVLILSTAVLNAAGTEATKKEPSPPLDPSNAFAVNDNQGDGRLYKTFYDMPLNVSILEVIIVICVTYMNFKWFRRIGRHKSIDEFLEKLSACEADRQWLYERFADSDAKIFSPSTVSRGEWARYTCRARNIISLLERLALLMDNHILPFSVVHGRRNVLIIRCVYCATPYIEYRRTLNPEEGYGERFYELNKKAKKVFNADHARDDDHPREVAKILLFDRNGHTRDIHKTYYKGGLDKRLLMFQGFYYRSRRHLERWIG